MSGIGGANSQRKSLRRKPPPAMDDYELKPTDHAAHPPFVGNVLSSSSNQEPFPDYQFAKTYARNMPPERSPMEIKTNFVRPDTTFTYEDDYLSHESPRPMGPKLLPFDDYMPQLQVPERPKLNGETGTGYSGYSFDSLAGGNDSRNSQYSYDNYDGDLIQEGHFKSRSQGENSSFDYSLRFDYSREDASYNFQDASKTHLSDHNATYEEPRALNNATYTYNDTRISSQETYKATYRISSQDTYKETYKDNYNESSFRYESRDNQIQPHDSNGSQGLSSYESNQYDSLGPSRGQQRDLLERYPPQTDPYKQTDPNSSFTHTNAVNMSLPESLEPNTSHLETPASNEVSRSPISIDSGRSRYRVRHFQNLGSEVSPFEDQPTDGSEEAGVATPPFLRKRQSVASAISTHSRNRSSIGSSLSANNAPYPVESELFDSDDLTDQDYSSASRLPHQGTPSRIPTLMDDLSRTKSFAATLSSSPEYKFLRRVPTNRSLSSSPELQNYSSPLSSPSKALSFRSPLFSHTYSNYVNGSRSSRSPSPKKYGESPPRTLLYPTEDFVDDFCNDSHFRTPDWSLIEHDYPDIDDSYLPSPSTFDYDNLPVIPKQDIETPNRNVTLKSTMSMFRKSQQISKYDDTLPPIPLDLPLLPFSSSALTTLHYAACKNVWSMKEVFAWCIGLSGWLHDNDISQKEFRKALVELVVFHKRHIPIDLISRNVTQLISSFKEAGVIFINPKLDGNGVPQNQKDLYVTIDVNGKISGVLVDLTDCYCNDKEHSLIPSKEKLWKCCSSRCQLNKTIEHEFRMKHTNIADLKLGADWANHWQLTAEDVNLDLSISKRQSLIFDLIKLEQTFINRAECFIYIAAPQFVNAVKLFAGQSNIALAKLMDDIIKPATELVKIHRNVLFEPLLRILIADGRLILNIGEISRLYEEWTTVARAPLLSYMSTVPMIEDLLRLESLKAWDEPLRNNPKIKELQVNGNLLLMSTFNSRYQQLPLQLADIRKSFEEHGEEYVNLTKAIDAIKKLGKRVNEMKVHADNIHSLQMLQKQLKWKSNIIQPNVNLSLEKRKFFFRGDVSRKGDLRINLHTVHLIVLDNYLLITERVRSQKALNFKVVEPPIPVDYIILENREKESSIASRVSTNPNISKQEADEELASYPFKIRYAGRGKGQSYTFLAPSENARKGWFAVFEKARSNMLKHVLPLTPYALKLIDNSYFAYEQANRITKLPILPPNDPVSIIARGSTTSMKNRGVPRDIYAQGITKNQLAYKKILCAEQTEVSGTQFTFLGLSNGVYCSDMKNRWKMIINMTNVTKVTVLPAFNIIIVLGNKSLRYFPLQTLIDIYYERADKTSSFQLGDNAVLFYEVGRHRGIPTVFVADKKTASSTNFVVYAFETDNNGIFSSFREIKKFYIQAECYGISVFNSSVAIHTQRGFEILDLQKLAPRTVPELQAPEQTNKKVDGYSRKPVQGVDAIRKIISHPTVRPMGMFKLANDKEFMMVYNECVIFVNKTGKLSRTDIMRFDFRPRSIAVHENNLFVVCEEVIQVWSISDQVRGTNKLIQVIPSKDISLLNTQQLLFGMAHPRISGLQISFCLEPKPNGIPTS